MLFYAIDCKNNPVKPVELNPKPRAITATYNVGETGDDPALALDNTSPIVEIEHNVWLGQSVVPKLKTNYRFPKQMMVHRFTQTE